MKNKIAFTHKTRLLAALIFLAGIYTGCKKFLDEKPDDKLVIISSVKDMQALLDNSSKVSFSDQPMSEVSADNYYMTDATFNNRTETERNQYSWAPANVFDLRNNYWADTYNVIYLANLVIDRANALEPAIEDKNALYAVRAQAQFHRAREFLNALSVWSKDYDPVTAGQDLGIPLPVEPDFNVRLQRATAAESYAKVVSDLKLAIPYLPLQTVNPIRPNKASAYGMLARTLLYMEDFKNARLYADSCLSLQSGLIDFNKLNPLLAFPVPKGNAEIIYESKMASATQIIQQISYINPELYALYPEEDLRKTIFFQRGALDYVFRGNYEGDLSFFNGIATDEILLIRAECAVRLGDVSSGLSDLNLLRKNRIKTASFLAFQGLSKPDALVAVKKERRLELPFRGLRWMDIKRWNSEGDQIMLVRKQNQGQYKLIPNDPGFAIAIPEDVIQLSGIRQNPR